MYIVGCHQPEIELPGEFDQLGFDLVLRFQAVVVNLHVEIVATEDLAQLLQHLTRLVGLPLQEPFVDRSRDAAAQADNPLGMRSQLLPVHPRFAVIAPLQVALGDELDEVFPARIVLGEEGEMGGAPTAGNLLPVLHRLRGKIDFAPQDRFYPLLAYRLVEFDRTIEITMVRHCHRRHSQLRRPGRDLLAAHRAIQRRVLGVQVKMDKRPGHIMRSFSSIAPPPTLAIPKRPAGEDFILEFRRRVCLESLKVMASDLPDCVYHSEEPVLPMLSRSESFPPYY